MRICACVGLRGNNTAIKSVLTGAISYSRQFFFVGKYSDDALTALSVVYPWQLIAIALAVGLALYFRTVKGRKKSEAQINQSAAPQVEEQTPSGKGEENG